MNSQQQLRHFEIVDCAVRSAEHFYLMASHTYQLDEEGDGVEGISDPCRGLLSAPPATGSGRFARSAT
ncbi:UNVERIFIED_ORG: hypothetical protein LHK14_23895 (plasmid) [Roseateles sp. XES5]|nr:hypothetical protein [Roseateles sp. XES5]